MHIVAPFGEKCVRQRNGPGSATVGECGDHRGNTLPGSASPLSPELKHIAKNTHRRHIHGWKTIVASFQYIVSLPRLPLKISGILLTWFPWSCDCVPHLQIRRPVGGHLEWVSETHSHTNRRDSGRPMPKWKGEEVGVCTCATARLPPGPLDPFAGIVRTKSSRPTGTPATAGLGGKHL